MTNNLIINSKNTVKIIVMLLFVLACMILVNCTGPLKNRRRQLEAGFQNPPESAKPRVWWHWMNGNITKKGIKADLEWMKRAGIGGFQNFDASLNTPQIVENRLIYMTPEWKDAFLYTTKMADSLGLEMAIAGSPGWSESGGPWVPASQAMKKYVWSELRIIGGKSFSGSLPHPPSATGSFQNISARSGSGGNPSKPLPEYYADAAVVAYKIPENDKSLTELNPIITSSGGKFRLLQLIDGDVVQSTILPASPVGKKSWIQFEFAKPLTIKALTLAIGNSIIPASSQALEAGDDGHNFRKILDIGAGRTSQRTFTFPPETARFFRFTVTANPLPAIPSGNSPGYIPQRSNTPAGIDIAELNLHTSVRINRFENKAGFTSAVVLPAYATPSALPSDIIRKADVIDLTSKMTQDGILTWDPPVGDWLVIRLGYSLTGHQNSPASPEATGFEVDKLNAVYVKNYFDNYLDQYKNATGGLMGKRGLRYVITDSWEAGVANWTDDMIREFNRRNGYDMLPWVPVLTGHIVESSGASDAFLWDFRKTLGEMVAEFHYDLLTSILHNRGMGRYSESHESGRAFIGDGMEVKRNADIPMSALWTPASETSGIAVRYKADIRESSSVAHLYGQNLVAAESMTARGNTWAYSPERLKPTADMELASGLNRFVIHTSVHQPVDDKIPGLGLGPYGQWFTRHETWAEQALPWTTYLARSSYMLQQGKSVADILYLYGENNNITALFGNKLPDIPKGYEYDFVNADALVNLLSVNEGHIVTPGGMSYNMLVLDSSAQYMSLPVIRKIREIVNAGAVVTGPKPVNTPSLKDDEKEFRLIAEELWGAGTGIKTTGKGKVFAGQTLAEVLNTLHIQPDFEYTKSQDNTEILYVHRKSDNNEIYWVNNRNNRTEDLEATFRVNGKAAEIWDPITGKIKQASYRISNGRTIVPLHLEPEDAVFIVFSKNTKALSRTIPVLVEIPLLTAEGLWEISFQPGRGAPEQITMKDLTAWNENTNPGVRYFSGTATYTSTIHAQAEWFKSDQELWLDLGVVKNLAEVIINGQSLGIVWKTPFRVKATKVLKVGENTLSVKVTNLWVNRLIGDQQPGSLKYTYTTQPFYKVDSPLLPSGLLGPVRIMNLSNK
jgi:hypothetical protein